MIQITQHQSLWLLFDPMRGFYRIASQNKLDAKQTIPRALASETSDWIPNTETLAKILGALAPTPRGISGLAPSRLDTVVPETIEIEI